MAGAHLRAFAANTGNATAVQANQRFVGVAVGLAAARRPWCDGQMVGQRSLDPRYAGDQPQAGIAFRSAYAVDVDQGIIEPHRFLPNWFVGAIYMVLGAGRLVLVVIICGCRCAAGRAAAPFLARSL